MNNLTIKINIYNDILEEVQKDMQKVISYGAASILDDYISMIKESKTDDGLNEVMTFALFDAYTEAGISIDDPQDYMPDAEKVKDIMKHVQHLNDKLNYSKKIKF